MFIKRGVDKKMWNIRNGILLSQNEIMPCTATWMGLEIVIPSEIKRTQILYDIAYMWNFLKMCINELIYKTYLGSQIQKTELWL